MILGTSCLIDVLRGEERTVEWERRPDQRGVGVVTSISAMVLWEEIQLTNASETEREPVESPLRGPSGASVDRDAAMRVDGIRAGLSDDGERIDVEDVMTAAIAIERDEPVLTRNTRHFERIPDLDVETYYARDPSWSERFASAHAPSDSNAARGTRTAPIRNLPDSGP